MIETQIIGSAVGIQRQKVIDKTESTPLPSLTNGVIIGRFKRGRMDKPFTVTNENYQALLGRDPKNASYLAVEDAFKRGVSEVKIMRVGSTGGGQVRNCMPNEVKVILQESMSYRLTSSLNGGARKTLTSSSPQYQTNPAQFMLDFLSLLTNYKAGSMDFLSKDFTSLGNNQPSIDENNQSFFVFCGIASDGTVIFENTACNVKDLAVTDLGLTNLNSAAAFLSVERITPVQTTLAIYPTEGARRDEDMYYGFDGANDNGDPVIIKSCARAVMAGEVTPPQDDGAPNFFKIHQATLKSNTGAIKHGLLYKDSDQPNIMRVTDTYLPNNNDSSFSAFIHYLLSKGYYHVDFNIDGSDPDVNYFYVFGVNESALETWDTSGKNPFNRGIELMPTTCSNTFYPSNADPIGAHITNDLFDLIIDPDSYTQSEIDYFAQWGIEPAIKNSDGSITAKTKTVRPQINGMA